MTIVFSGATLETVMPYDDALRAWHAARPTGAVPVAVNLHPAVLEFAQAMENKLKDTDNLSWRDVPAEGLAVALLGAVQELVEEFSDSKQAETSIRNLKHLVATSRRPPSGVGVRLKATDVANCAMMIYDRLRPIE